jgi:hypothetical protein
MDRPKLLKAEAARWSTTGSQPAVLRDGHRKSKNWDTEKNRRNKADKHRAHVCRIYLSLGNGANKTEVTIAGTWMHQTMGSVTDGKETREEQQDGEQTCKRGMNSPLSDDRFSSFLQAVPINHDATQSASPKCWTEWEVLPIC